MVFNSIFYILFLSITVLAFYIFSPRIRWIWLLIASIGYYLSFIPVFIFLLLGLTVTNYFLANWLAKVPDERKTVLLIVAITGNLLVLSLFKYFNILFPANHLHLYSVSLSNGAEPVNKMILPLGLSYFAFTLLSYLIEIKRTNILPEKHFGYFSLYLFFFPKIAQGPIERPQQLLPQLRQNRGFDYTMLVEGLKLMLWGYFKKLVIADRLGIYVNAIYNNSEKHNGSTLLLATVFYAFQIYADFSGYTDIARGSAKLFGFDLSENFKRPYFATSIKEFWNRWHITFSTWLRDYIFLPLAYFLSGKMKKPTYLFISSENWIYLIVSMTTFAICGIWHGVGWNYLFWGILFGIYLTYSNWAKDFHKKLRKFLHIKKTSPYLLVYKTLTTFMLVLLGWIFFRAATFTEATKIVGKIFTSAGPVFFQSPYDLIYSIIAILFLITLDLKREFFNNRLSIMYSKYQVVRIAGIVAIVVIILLIGVFDGGQFIYFQY